MAGKANVHRAPENCGPTANGVKKIDIWLGTGKGIATIPCAGYVTDYACEAEQICVDRKDGSGFCDYLLEDEIITCIAVDAANRKCT